MSHVILDVDTGEDDALAIILAVNMQLDVRLVVSPSTYRSGGRLLVTVRIGFIE